ncbi:MAG: hypothetical protein IJ966_00490 [Bacilli bacterium]|jgi:hypothetical protein|nr:hypothetical protein [Bacilli bacterium]
MNKAFNDLFNTNPRFSTSISFILGLLLVDNLTAPEQNMLGNWIILLGQTILTNAASQNIIESRINGTIININSKEVKCMYNPLVYNIETIRNIINQIYPDNNNDIETLQNILNDLQKQINELKKD